MLSICSAKRLWVLPAALLAFTVVSRLPLIDMPLERDEGEYAYVAGFPSAELVPFRDSSNHRGPFPFLLYKAGMAAFGRSARGIHVFLSLYVALAALVLYAICLASAGDAAAAFFGGLTFTLLLFEPMAGIGAAANIESMLLLPMLLAFLLFLLARRRVRACFALSGLFMGMALMTKHTAMLGCVLLAAWRFVEEPDRRSMGRDLALYAAGCAAVPMGYVAYFAVKGCLKDFLYYAYYTSFTYAMAPPMGFADLASYWWKAFYRFSVPAYFWTVPLFAMGAVRRTGGDDSHRKRLLIWLAVSALGIVPTQRFFPRYNLEAYPAFAALCGLGASRLLEKLRDRFPGWGKASLGAILAAACSAIPFFCRRHWIASTPGIKSRMVYGAQPFAEAQAIGRYVEMRSRPEDTVFVWGQDPQILFYAKRRSATKSLMLATILDRVPEALREQKKVYAEVLRNDPRIIVFCDIITSTLMTDRSERFLLERTKQLIRANYALDGLVVLGLRPEDTLYLLGPEAVATIPQELVAQLNDLDAIYIYRRRDGEPSRPLPPA